MPELILLAGVTSFALTYLARIAAPKLGLIDTPDGNRKAHAAPTPLMGGVALFASLLITLGAAAIARADWLVGNADSLRLVVAIMASAGLFCLFGFLDDSRPVRPRTKLLLQVVASIPFVVWGRSIDSVELLGVHLDLGWFGIVFTIFWLVACTNIVNLADGLDGLAGAIGVIVCVAIAVHSMLNGYVVPAALALVFSASLVGFLLHNWPPAKVFLGDAGSLVIGFIIGALSIESSLKTSTSFAMATPLVLVSIPVFDTFMAILRRKLHGRGIGEADRRHIHHHLQDCGFTRSQTLLAISLLCVATAAVALVSAYYHSDLLALALCMGLLGLLVVGRVFGNHETLLFLRLLRAVSLTLADASGIFRTRLFQLRMGNDPHEQTGERWDHLIDSVRTMGGSHLEFVDANNESGKVFTRRTWTADEGRQVEPRGADWQFRYSLPGADDRRTTLIASGQTRPQLKEQRWMDLFRIFESFCRNWRAEDTDGPVITPAAAVPVIAMPSRDPDGVSDSDDEAVPNRRVA